MPMKHSQHNDVELEATALGHLCKQGAFVIASPELAEVSSNLPPIDK